MDRARPTSGPAAVRAVLVVAALAAAGCVPRVNGHHAEINGLRMYYEIYGHGPALLLLHGGGGDGRQFSEQIPDFRWSHRLIVPDACAQGRTTDRPGPLSYHAMAEDAVALLDRLHIRSADVMGWSDGAIVGLDLAMHHPDRVRHLVSFGANATPDGLTEDFENWLRGANAESFGPASRQSYEAISPEPAHYEQAMHKILAMWRTQPNFSAADLGRIRAHTLIAAGENDIIRREHTEQIAHEIPGARLWIVPGTDHGAIRERPDLVNHEVLEFLSH
jgi:pimeloyl-ACP methyl ester carboxylesterase